MTPYDSMPRRRRSDESNLWKIAEVIRHYAIFWFPLLWIINSLGFSLITPRLTAAQVQDNVVQGDKRLQAQVDTLKLEHAAVAEQLAKIQAEVGSIVKLNCIDPKIPIQLKQIALPCSN